MLIPRALSTVEGYNGYQPDAHVIGCLLHICLDDVPQHDLAAYDLDAGNVVRPLRDDAGKLCLTDDQTAIAYETVPGRVTVTYVGTLPQPAAQAAPKHISRIKVPIDRFTSDITLRVVLTGVKGWRCRLWLAARLVQLAGAIAGVRTFIDVAEV